MNQLLWSPNQQQIDGAAITAFAKRYAPHTHNYEELYQWSIANREDFWSALWDFCGVIGHKGERVLVDDQDMMAARWFPEAQLNFAENLLRQDFDGESDTALVFWGEDRVKQRLSRAELRAQVSRLAQALKAQGVQPGDRVAGFLPNMPQTLAAMLATASLGAVWTCCSPDFGVNAAVDRLGQVEPKILFTADAYYYNGKCHDSLQRAEEIAAQIPSVQKLVVFPYAAANEGRAELPQACSAITVDDFVAPFKAQSIDYVRVAFNHPLYILFSSGTTGVPKCIVHSVGGTLLQHLKEHRLQTDIKAGDKLFYFTTCGWMMWNWLVSGLAVGATLMLYDGSPFYPSGNILFQFAAEEGFNVFGTSAKFIDACHKQGLHPGKDHDLSSLRSILSTGSPLSPEGFDYVYQEIKSDVCLSSISGGTDIVSCFVLGNPISPVYKGEIQCRGLGMAVDVFDEEGNSLRGEKGELVCTKAFPAMPIGFWNDPDNKKYHEAYFDLYDNVWSHGDYAEITERGGVVIYGRSDAVLNPGGVRIGTAEIYRQLEDLAEVKDAVVVGQDWQDDVRVILFVVLKEGITLSEELVNKIKQQIRANTTPRHVPAKVLAVKDIPYTRSGKVVELAVRNVIHGEAVKNKASLANPEALDNFTNLPELQS